MSAKNSIAAKFFEPMFRAPVIKLRQNDGSLLIMAGKPELMEPEVTISQFNKETGASKRYIATLCEEGFIKHRRLSPKKHSKILIPRSEVDRYLKLDGDDCERATMPSGGLKGVQPAFVSKNALAPGAKRGGLILARSPNSKKPI